MAKSYMDEARRIGNFKHCWKCPYCSAERGYGEGEVERLRKVIENKERVIQSVTADNQRVRKERDHFHHSRNGILGNLAKIKKRVAHGVCPCCKRTFSALQQHIAKQHPEYLQETKKETKSE